MTATATKTQRPEFGRLVWTEKGTGREVVIRQGPWALLQSNKKRLQKDPAMRGGKLTLKYL